MIYSLYVISKSGGVIFHYDTNSEHDENEYIRLGSLFYSFNGMAEHFSPLATPGNLLSLNTDTYSLRCIYPDSGTTFFVLGDPHETQLDSFLQNVYELYCNYTLKNPYWAIDQPVNTTCEKFVTSIEALVSTHNSTRR